MSDPLEGVMLERARQDKKWGVQDHDDPAWLMILAEEVGEAAELVLATMQAGDPYKSAVARLVVVGQQAQALIEDACELGCPQHQNTPGVEREATQVTAVGLAWLECMVWRRPPTSPAQATPSASPRELGRAADSAWEADRNRLEQQEAEAQDKAHPQIRPMTQLENAYMDLEGKLGQANAHIEALEKEAATLHAALMVFEAGWSTGGYLDPLDFWDKCFKRLNDLVPPDHRSFVWAVEQEMRDRAPLRGEEET